MLAAAAPRPVQDVSIDYDVCIYPTSKERWPAPRARRRRRARGGGGASAQGSRGVLEVSERHCRASTSRAAGGGERPAASRSSRRGARTRRTEIRRTSRASHCTGASSTPLGCPNLARDSDCRPPNSAHLQQQHRPRGADAAAMRNLEASAGTCSTKHTFFFDGGISNGGFPYGRFVYQVGSLF